MKKLGGIGIKTISLKKLKQLGRFWNKDNIVRDIKRMRASLNLGQRILTKFNDGDVGIRAIFLRNSKGLGGWGIRAIYLKEAKRMRDLFGIKTILLKTLNKLGRF
jgi:hypothetical protein